ncbi:hypothetical protein RDI58_012720 [Solanum bulbocastanum]|uniref:Uncharacterized protein n=1 Tax=Solanum bulbocastanum TaxID=147425 RepID=A0AAN8YEL6_SOLBU
MSSEEETDISESEMKECADKWYQKLKEGYVREKICVEVYQCPFCSGQKKQAYSFSDLVQHSSGVSKGGSQRRKLNDKTKHLGLTKYLKNKDSLPLNGRRYVGKSGSWLRNDLTKKGFNPLRVRPLWNYRVHSGKAVVEFRNDWKGFASAIKFQNNYELQQQGKKDYLVSQYKGDKLYGWVAKADDYNSSDIIGDYLRKNGDIKSISEVEVEEKRKADSLVSSLANTIEAKRKSIKEIESKCNETFICLSNYPLIKIITKNFLFTIDFQRIEKNARDQLEKMLKNQETSKLYIEARRKELELRERELMERKAFNDNQRPCFNKRSCL